MNESAFKERLENLSHEIGGEIIIVEDSARAQTESLIEQVANGEIHLTVTDQTLGLVNSIYFPDLDVSTVLSLPQQIAWAVRNNSPDLRVAVNNWLSMLKQSGRFKILFDKYFNSPRSSQLRISSDYSSRGGSKLSPYDEEIKREAQNLGWDWRLLASVIYQESNFRPNAESWAGAVGLMQLMPATALSSGRSTAPIHIKVCGRVPGISSILTNCGQGMSVTMVSVPDLFWPPTMRVFRILLIREAWRRNMARTQTNGMM